MEVQFLLFYFKQKLPEDSLSHKLSLKQNLKCKLWLLLFKGIVFVYYLFKYAYFSIFIKVSKEDTRMAINKHFLAANVRTNLFCLIVNNLR